MADPGDFDARRARKLASKHRRRNPPTFSHGLGLILPHAHSIGLTQLEVTTEPANAASQAVIVHNGGRFVEEYVNPSYGPEVRLRYAIDLA